MRYAKYVLIGLCVLLSLLITVELYKSYSADFDGYDHFVIEQVIQDEEQLAARLEKMADLMEQNGLDYFIVNEIMQDSSRVKLELYCSSDEVRQKLVKSELRAEGTYNSLFYGGVTINYGEDFEDFAQAEHTSDTAYLCIVSAIGDVSALDYKAEYFAENLITGESNVSYLLLIRCMWALTAFCILLLSMVDSYTYQKTLFIQLAYGYESKVLILRRLCKEGVGLFLAFFVPVLLLHSCLPFAVVTTIWWLSALLALLIDAVIMLYPFWNFNCRAVLGQGQHAGRILTVCYGVRVVLLIVALLLSTAAVRQIGIYMGCMNLNAIFQNYRGYAYIQTGEPVTGDVEQIMVFRADAVIPTRSGTNCEVFVANAQAAVLLEGVISEIGEVGENQLVIFFPDNMEPEDLTESGKDFMLACAETIDADVQVQYADYPAGATLSYLEVRGETENCRVVNTDLTICYSENPIVIYYTGASADSDYYGTGFLQISEQKTGNYINIYQSYEESVNMYRLQCLMWVCIAVIFLGLLHLLRMMILRLEHSINAMELCLKKINGMPLLERYERMSAGTLLSYTLGTIVSLILLKEMGGIPCVSVFFVAIILFVSEMALTVLEIRRWEKTHIMKILKGGCL